MRMRGVLALVAVWWLSSATRPAAAQSATDKESAGAQESAEFARDRATAIAPKLCTIKVRVTEPKLAELTIMIGDRALQPAAETETLVEPGEISVTIGAPHTPPLRKTLTCAAGATCVVRFPATRSSPRAISRRPIRQAAATSSSPWAPARLAGPP